MESQPFEIDLIRTFVEPVALKDGRLLALDREDMSALLSSDGGRTWDRGGPLLDVRGGAVVGEAFTRAYIVNLLRLRSGEIALKFEAQQEGPGGAASPQVIAYFTKSDDEGATWSDPVRITPLETPSNATWLIETSEGNLLLPIEYAYSQSGGDRRAKMSVCTVFISADGGRSWQESSDGLWLDDDGGAVKGLCEVPVVAETVDRRLLMFMRTMYQRIAETTSDDGGNTWSPVRLNDLVGSNAEMYLARIPSTGDLLCVWNQASGSEIETGFYRARLTAAISADGGATWGSFRTLADSPGQAQAGRIEDPNPPSYLRTPTAVPPEGYMVDEEFHMNRAPRVSFVEDDVYVTYTHRRYRYVDGERVQGHDGVKLRVLPVEWFYSGK